MSKVLNFPLKRVTPAMSNNDRATSHANVEFKKRYGRDEPIDAREYSEWGSLWTEWFQFHSFKRG